MPCSIVFYPCYSGFFFTAMVISKHLIIIIIIIIIVIIVHIIIDSPTLLRICSFITQGNRG